MIDHDDTRIVIVGGCGRVGLPLGLAFASRGCDVTLYDTNREAVAKVTNGDMPYVEHDTFDLAAAGSITATTQPSCIANADVVIIVIGTPIDEHLNPDPLAVPAALRPLLPYFRHHHLLVLRSTLYPGTTHLVEQMLIGGGRIDIATCPERIAEGRAMSELFTLPQIVGARTDSARDRAARLFLRLTDEVVDVTPEEAELAKLFTNAWRYIRFAAANQLYMLATAAHVDYDRVRHAVTHNYPRAADLPGAGFVAGPCLLKDTLQLAAFGDNQFGLGHAAMLTNECLPLWLATRIDQRYGLASMVVGILGMAFKGGSDDTRDSLAFKLRKILSGRALDVVCADDRVDDPRLSTVDQVLEQADLIVIAAPHPEYRDLKTDLPIVDMWGLTGRGVQL